MCESRVSLYCSKYSRIMFYFACLVILFSFSALSILANPFEDHFEPTVVTQNGQIRGKVISTPTGQCSAYLGVPFAAPPIGDLRWKKPEPPISWSEVRNATDMAPSCIQIINNGSYVDSAESEDCLYLNIIVPKSENRSAKLPVMVFIHGGGLIMGDARIFGDKGPCDNLANRGVIVVLIQYRLGLFGLLSSGDDAAKGNYAIWDQIEALKWLCRNIEAFGGDAGKITIFGESSGAQSVSYLSYTPVAQDLYHQGIGESGSAKVAWASLRDTSVRTTLDLAKAANCTQIDSKSMLDCLRQLSSADLQKIFTEYVENNYKNMSVWESMPILVAVRVDGELYTTSNLVELEKKKPTIIGVNSREVPPDKANIPVALKAFDQALDKFFDKDKNNYQILKDVAYFVYLDSKGDRNDSIFVTQQISKVQDHDLYAGAAQEAASKAAAGFPVWTYNFDHWTDSAFEPDYPFEKGAVHASELCFVFATDDTIEECPKKFRGADRIVATYMGEMWTNFAKNGDPSLNHFVWPNFHNLTHANTLRIREHLSLEPQFYLETERFWNHLVPTILNA